MTAIFHINLTNPAIYRTELPDGYCTHSSESPYPRLDTSHPLGASKDA